MGPPAKRRKTNTTAVPEINFDFASREDYLTGFHKRKVARTKHAQELAVKKEREEKIRDRAALRQRRKDELEAHVLAVNDAMRNIEKRASEARKGPGDESGSDEEWTGFEEPSLTAVDREDEYVDEEKYTTVTVEAVDITKDGFVLPGDEGDDDSDQRPAPPVVTGRAAQAAANKEAAEVKKREAKAKPKKKKKKFRYENKIERRMERFKQKSKNSAQAEKRKNSKEKK